MYFSCYHREQRKKVIDSMPNVRSRKLNQGKWDRITHAALKEFTCYGYKDASFNRIIRQSGLSKGTMYYYFDSKEDLYRTVIDSILEKLPPLKPSNHTAEKPDDFWLECSTYVEWLFESYKSHRYVAQLIRNVLSDPVGCKNSPLSTVVSSIHAWLEDLLVNGQICGAVRRDLPLELLIDLSWGIWRIVGIWHGEMSAHSGRLSTSGSAVSTLLEFFRRNLEPVVRSTNHSVAPVDLDPVSIA